MQVNVNNEVVIVYIILVRICDEMTSMQRRADSNLRPLAWVATQY